MFIRELTRQGSLALLKRIHRGRLACARENQPYVFPVFFGNHDSSLYCASTTGQKIEWMRENPLVAVEVDEIESAQNWESVIVTGRYEVAGTPEALDMRQLAWSLLQNANLWEPAYVKTILGDVEREMAPLYFRIRIGRITGHRATKE